MITDQDDLDRLPDEILLAIFERIRDVRTLVRLLSLCRRFRSLVPLVDSISLCFTLPHQVPPRKPRASFLKNPLGFLLNRILQNPIRRLASSVKSRGGGMHCFDKEGMVVNIVDRLRVFGVARDVRVILPCQGELADKSRSYLKWQASYGSQIRSCVILGAIEVRSIGESDTNREEGPVAVAATAMTMPLLSDGELKHRVVWILSCLIVASFRHCTMKKVIAKCPALRMVVVGDVRQQGKVVIGEDEVSEIRMGDNHHGGEDNDATTREKNKVPDLKMKLWHARSLELPRCGVVLKGASATLVVITPVVVDGGNEDRDEDEILLRWIEEEEEEDEVFVEAVEELRKRNEFYLMEMNSF